MGEQILTGANCVDIRAVIGADAMYPISIRPTSRRQSLRAIYLPNVFGRKCLKIPVRRFIRRLEAFFREK